MTTRRTFLTQTGLAAAALMAAPAVKALNKRAAGKGVAGLQLYSLRDQLPKDPQGWLKKVADAGYKNVETFGLTNDNKFFGLDLNAFKSELEKNNLITTSGHYGIDDYFASGKEDNLNRYIKSVQALNQKYLTVPYLGENLRKTEDDWKSLAEKFNTLATKLKTEGIKMAYHNHNFEFVKVNGDTRGLDILLNNTEKGLVNFEMDLYWVVRGGGDPIALFKEHPGRFVMWHIKDMDKNDHTKNTEVGAGTIDFVKIFQYHIMAGEQETFMEQENYAPGMDPYTSIAQSAAYIKNKLLV